MILTAENYFSKEADREYLSASQYNLFRGTSVRKPCEARAMAILSGEWVEEPSKAMLVGSYVDAYFENTLDKFKQDHPEIFTQKGVLLSDFKQAEELILFAEKDSFLIDNIRGDGEAQVIVTGTINGVKFKGKIDRLHHGKAIVDLKIVASIREKVWNPDTRTFTNFIEAYGYEFQGAIYKELWKQMSGEDLPFFIAAISKEKVPDKEIIFLPDSTLNNALDIIKEKVESIQDVKTGKFPPLRCGMCDYCRSIKMLESPISLADLWM